MPLVAFETSCDETSAAVVHQGAILSNVVSSQIGVHADYGGVVSEFGAREHLPNLMPLAQAALRDAGVRSDEIEAGAGAPGPGLPRALMVGLQAAQAQS